MCNKNCECGEHINTQPVTEQDLALQFRTDTGKYSNQDILGYQKWLENKILANQNYQKTMKSCNDEINKVIEDDLNE